MLTSKAKDPIGYCCPYTRNTCLKDLFGQTSPFYTLLCDRRLRSRSELVISDRFVSTSPSENLDRLYDGALPLPLLSS